MPTSVTAGVVFAVLIVPGFMAISGFSATRARSSLDRDLYVVAQAVVVSLIWALVVFLVQAWIGGNRVEGWGVLPFDADRIAAHRQQVAVAALVILVVAPGGVGTLWGWLL